MVEGRVQPVGSVVALVASLGEVRGDVIRIRRTLIVLQVATHASHGVQGVIVVDVAVGTSSRGNRVHSS